MAATLPAAAIATAAMLGIVAFEPLGASFRYLPDDQRAAFSDYVITRAEYEAAFDRFALCAEGQGKSVTRYSNNPFTDEIVYGASGELLPPGQTGGGAVNECYQKYFAQTEIIFSTASREVLSNLDEEQMHLFDQHIRPCLELIGAEVPDDLVVGSAEWVRLLDANTAAHDAGKCDGI